MSTRFPRLRSMLYATPWAIMPDRLEAMVEVFERRADGIRLSPEEIAALKGMRQPNGSLVLVPMAFDDDDERAQRTGVPRAAGGQAAAPAPGSTIAVINMMGIVAQHASQVDDISGPGGTSTERVMASIDRALADPSVKAIVANIDSPGGGVYGVEELFDYLMAARGDKPLVAQVNSLAASAAYWAACGFDEIVVTPSGQVGSIGVYALHTDVSGAAEKAGVKYTYVSAGKYKVEGNPTEPLGDDAAAAIQADVDSYYASFTAAVAKGRGVPVAQVREGFGQGRVVRAQDAVKAGMADRVATLDETLRRLGAQRQKPAATRAEAPSPAPQAEAEQTTAEPPAPAGFDLDAHRRRRHAHRSRSR